MNHGRKITFSRWSGGYPVHTTFLKKYFHYFIFNGRRDKNLRYFSKNMIINFLYYQLENGTLHDCRAWTNILPLKKVIFSLFHQSTGEIIEALVSILKYIFSEKKLTFSLFHQWTGTGGRIKWHDFNWREKSWHFHWEWKLTRLHNRISWIHDFPQKWR